MCMRCLCETVSWKCVHIHIPNTPYSELAVCLMCVCSTLLSTSPSYLILSSPRVIITIHIATTTTATTSTTHHHYRLHDIRQITCLIFFYDTYIYIYIYTHTQSNKVHSISKANFIIHFHRKNTRVMIYKRSFFYLSIYLSFDTYISTHTYIQNIESILIIMIATFIY